jgi:inner membrane protein
VEPVTQALTSLAVARAGQRQLPRHGTAIVLVAGLAPALDYASYLGGAGTFLRFHRALLHSVGGAVFVACAAAAVFLAIDKRPGRAETKANAKPPLRLVPALIAALVGAGVHVLLGVASGVGVSLLWPFRPQRYAWNLLTNLDPWILIFLLAGLLIPELLRLVSEEIGDRKKRERGRTAAILALAAFACYVGARVVLHARAAGLLMSSDYNKATPLSGDAFPSSGSLLDWRGVAVTDNTIEAVRVPLGPGEQFNPDGSVTYYKPQPSPALTAGQAAASTRLYLKYARFPLASVTQREDGYRFEVHDLQFASDDMSPENTFVRVDLDSGMRVVSERILFAASPEP